MIEPAPAPSPQWEVLRGGRKVFNGTLARLVEFANAGGLRPGDRIAGGPSGEPIDVHAVPELARLVPSQAEYLTARSLKALILFDVVMGPLMAITLIAALLTPHQEGAARDVVLAVVAFAAMFGLPIVPLMRRKKKLSALRAAGDVSGVVPDPTPADRELRLLLARSRPVTRALCVSLVVPFALSFVLPPHWLEEHFAKINGRIAAGEVWRLATAMFLHAGIGHLFFNVSALAEFGRMVENLFGRGRLLAVYFAAGIVGFAASTWFSASPSVGASGGIFGLIGVLFTVGLRYRSKWPVTMRTRLIVELAVCIGLNVAFGLISTFIDNAAHFGGFVTGVAFGLTLRLQPDVAEHLESPR